MLFSKFKRELPTRETALPDRSERPFGVPRTHAVLGNPTFQLSLTGAQVGSVMAIGVSPGGCNTPGLPVFCGQWHPALATTFFFPTVPVAGAGVCQGSAQMPVPIPTNFALCGAPLCFQSVVVCVSAVGPGINLTNAVETVLN